MGRILKKLELFLGKGPWKIKLGRTKIRIFQRKKITSAVSGNQRPSFKINLSDSQTLPLSTTSMIKSIQH